MNKLTRSILTVGFAGLALVAGTAARPVLDDEPVVDDEKDEGPILPDNPFAPPPGEDPLVQEMRELFQQVERTLGRIDVRLADAGAGMAPLEEVPDSGLDDLLQNAQEGGRQVVSDIDRILELAEQMGGT